MLKFKKNLLSFTLAEVLITLTIIGVVAALTIPSIMIEKEKQEIVSRLKKTYATLENARRLTAIDEGGDISELFSADDSTGGNVAMQAFAKHLNVSKNCGSSTGCWYDDLKNLNNNLWNVDGKYDSKNENYNGRMILSDGTLLYLFSSKTSCITNNITEYSPQSYRYFCGQVRVDINGKKGPNTIGRDVFLFDITRDGIYPTGITQSDSEINSNCSKTGNGNFCTVKVLKEGSINY